MKLEFFWQTFKNPQILDFMKIHPVGIELFHADRWTDRQTDRRAETFRNFADAPKNHMSTWALHVAVP